MAKISFKIGSPPENRDEWKIGDIIPGYIVKDAPLHCGPQGEYIFVGMQSTGSDFKIHDIVLDNNEYILVGQYTECLDNWPPDHLSFKQSDLLNNINNS